MSPDPLKDLRNFKESKTLRETEVTSTKWGKKACARELVKQRNRKNSFYP
jgi:hypothetical protein